MNRKADSTHTHVWTSTSIGSYGTLYTNTALRMNILVYNRTNVSISSANSWINVETLSALPNAPWFNLSGTTTSPILNARLTPSKVIQARATTTGSSYGVTSQFIWTY